MAEAWLVDENIVEVRVARLVNGRLAGIWHFPQLDSLAKLPRMGDVFCARIASISPTGAFLDLGTSGQGFMRAVKRANAKEGAIISALVVQEDGHGKLARLRLVESRETIVNGGRKPGRVSRGPDAVRTLIENAHDGDPIQIGSLSLWRRFLDLAKGAAPGLPQNARQESPDVYEREGVEAQIEQALEPLVQLPAGGRLTIETTQALTAIDVDTANARDACAVNLAAAQQIPYEIGARGLSGTILVDFARTPGRELQSRLRRELVEGGARLGLQIDAGLGRRGLIDMRLARTRSGLADRLTIAKATHSAVTWRYSYPAQSARLARRLAQHPPAGAIEVLIADGFSNWLHGEGRPVKVAIEEAAPQRLIFSHSPRFDEDWLELRTI